MKHKPLREPQDRYTVLDNIVMDYLMPTMSGNEFKILMLIIRSTIGWHKEEDQLSYSQIQKRTGIKSKTTIGSCLTSLKEKQYIIEIKHNDQWEANTYALNTEFEIDTESIPKNDTVSKNGIEPVSKNGIEPVSKNGHTKESNKNSSEKKKDFAPVGAFTPPPMIQNSQEPPKQETDESNPIQEEVCKVSSAAVPPAPLKPAKKEPSPHQQLMAAYQDALGYKIPNGAKEGVAAKKILNADYSIEQMVGCYQKLKEDYFWRDKHVSLHTVYEQLGPYCQNGNGISVDYAEMDADAEFARMNAHLPPLDDYDD